MPGRGYCARGGGGGDLCKARHIVHEMKVLKRDIPSACFIVIPSTSGLKLLKIFYSNCWSIFINIYKLRNLSALVQIDIVITRSFTGLKTGWGFSFSTLIDTSMQRMILQQNVPLLMLIRAGHS